MTIYGFDDQEDAVTFAELLGDNGCQPDWIVLVSTAFEFEAKATGWFLAVVATLPGSWRLCCHLVV